jgi:hypothetical protein
MGAVQLEFLEREELAMRRGGCLGLSPDKLEGLQLQVMWLALGQGGVALATSVQPRVTGTVCSKTGGSAGGGWAAGGPQCGRATCIWSILVGGGPTTCLEPSPGLSPTGLCSFSMEVG